MTDEENQSENPFSGIETTPNFRILTSNGMFFQKDHRFRNSINFNARQPHRKSCTLIYTLALGGNLSVMLFNNIPSDC